MKSWEFCNFKSNITPFCRDVQAEIKPNGFYGRGGTGHVARVLHCRGGLSDIAGCAVTTGCPSGLTVGMRCRKSSMINLNCCYNSF